MQSKNNSTKQFTRGGQITLHNIRMFMQIMNKVNLFLLFVFIFVSGVSACLMTDHYDRYVVVQYSYANMSPLINENAITDFISVEGRHMIVRMLDIKNSQITQYLYHQALHKLMLSGMIGIFASIIASLFAFAWLRDKGEKQSKEIPIKGDTLASRQHTKDIICNSKENSDLTLANLPLIKNAETMHFLFHGTTGSGKSNAIKELLEQIQTRGDRAIIFDRSGSFLEEFYREHQDVLLNPLDNRSEAWDLWVECRDAADFDSLAAAQIPMPLSSQDPFWVNAARTIFSATAFQMRNDKDRSVHKLLQYLLSVDLGFIQEFLKNTEAESLVSEKMEKTAVSIKSVLATYLKSLRFIREGRNPFSIRNWIQNDNARNWLFITSIADRHETIKPLITSWIDVAVNALLSLPPNNSRRIWIVFDELTSLQQLPYLTQMLSEARKFGGCAIIGIQNYAQLEKLYGQSGAKDISSALNTRLIFRQPDPEMARWSALNLGESIIEEVREGISYGANTMRDGISINRVETRRPIVSYSEIMSLGNLQAYIRLPGKYPITHLDFTYKSRRKITNPFVARAIDIDTIKSTEAIIKQSEKSFFDVASNLTQSPAVLDPQNATTIANDKARDREIGSDIQNRYTMSGKTIIAVQEAIDL